MAAILVLLLINIDYAKLAEEYEIGHNLFLQGSHHDAAEYFQSMLGRYGESQFEDEIRFRLGECYFGLGDYTKARKNFEIIVKNPSRSYLKPECLYAIGLINILQNNLVAAEDVLHQLLESPAYENEERVSLAIGVLYYFRQNYQAAKEKLAGNGLLEAKFYYAKSCARLGEPLAALSAFKEIVDQVPNTPIAALAEFSSAEALFFNQDFDGAKIKFQSFILKYANSPLYDYACYFLAACLLHTGEYALSAEYLFPLVHHPNNLLSAHASYFLGMAYLYQGDGASAINAFQRVRANHPNTQVSSYANLQLTYALISSGDTLQALVSAAQLASMYVSGELASVGEYLTGKIYFETGSFYDAAENFEAVVERYPNSSLREPAAAMLLYSLNNSMEFDRAVTFGSKYINDFSEEKNPWRGQVLYFLADAYYYSVNYAQAENAYLKVTRDFSGSEITPYAKLGLAFAKYHQERNEEALEILEGLSKVAFDDSSLTIAVYLGLGYVQYNLGQYLNALDAFEAVYNTYPNDQRSFVSGLFYAGLCYYKLEYYAQALEAWEKLINTYQLSEKSAEAGFRAGDTYFKALDYKKARALFRLVVETHPTSEYARLSQLAIAQSYYNEQNSDEAIREFQKFLDLFPASDEAVSARKGMEMSYYRLGLESTEAMRIFVERFPQSELGADGQYKIAYKSFETQDYQIALDEFVKVLVNYPNSSLAPDALLLAAESAVNLEDWKRASELYERYLIYFPKGSARDAVYFNLGTAYYHLKEYSKALGNFETVVDSFPNSSYLGNAQHNIETCRKLLGEEGTGPPEEIKTGGEE